MRRLRVSSFLAEMTQQIHSFRASGVMAAHRRFAASSDSMALRKSGGSLCGTLDTSAAMSVRRNKVDGEGVPGSRHQPCHGSLRRMVRQPS